jgi:hypothetical protein
MKKAPGVDKFQVLFTIIDRTKEPYLPFLL